MKLDLLQWLCSSPAAHTPDNSFMGFVAEELNETERLNIQRNKVNNMAVVYGKDASMWKVSVPRRLPQIPLLLICVGRTRRTSNPRCFGSIR